MTLARLSYSIAEMLPESQRFGLASQIERSAVSIPSNISEGSGRSSDKDFVRFLHIAYGSACELETQLLLARDLGFVSSADTNRAVDEAVQVRRMIFALKSALSG